MHTYIAKKLWTSDINVKIKGNMKRQTILVAQIIYIMIAVTIATLLSVIMLHAISEGSQQEQEQSNTESKLPYGNYLPDSDNPTIRVVIKTSGFKQEAHSEVQFSAAQGLIVSVGKNENTEIATGEVIHIKPDDTRFQNGTICIKPKVKGDRVIINSLNRGYGSPSYRGTFELFSTAEGVVIVNELPLEEYLYAVVPSEMPASYAPEALKCQAICARSYAHCQMLTFSYPEYNAHVDDSVSFQVYGNSREQDSTIRAVNETMGQKLWYQDGVVTTYYYSTSCGKSTSVEAWGTELAEHNQYLQGVNICNGEGEDYESKLPWYRWTAVIPSKVLGNLIELNTGTELGTLQSVTVTREGVGGIALQIVAKGSKGKVTVDTENKIRSALGGSGYQITKQDGKVVNSTKLLPSAFFTIAKNGGNYIIKGGGYGHGIGMSQNGANEMAKAGKTYEEILQFFYPGTKVR